MAKKYQEDEWKDAVADGAKGLQNRTLWGKPVAGTYRMGNGKTLDVDRVYGSNGGYTYAAWISDRKGNTVDIIENIKDADGVKKAVEDLRARNGKPKRKSVTTASNRRADRAQNNSATASRGASNG